MSPAPAQFVIEEKVLIADAQRKLKEMETSVKQHERTLNRFAAVNSALNDTIAKSETKKGTVHKAVNKTMMMNLRHLRWELITTMFFFRVAGAVIRQAFESMGEAADEMATRGGIRALARTYERDVGLIIEEIRKLNNYTVSAQKAFSIAQAGMVEDQGQFADSYAEAWYAARVAAVTSGADIDKTFSALVESLAEGRGEAIDAVAPIFQVQLALEKAADATGREVEELGKLEAANIIMQTVMNKTNQLVEEGAGVALEAAEGFQQLQASWDGLKDVVGVAVQMGVNFEALNQVLTTVAQLVAIINAHMADIEARMPRWAASLGPLIAFAGMAGIWSKPGPAYFKAMEKYAEAMGIFSEETNKGLESYERFDKKLEKAAPKVDPIVDHLLRREEILERHAERVAEIDESYWRERDEIEARYQRDFDRIGRRAQLDRERALRSHVRRELDKFEDFNLRQRHELEDHLRKMRHREQQYRMDREHDEALYQYERMLLVAEGDVLAIEDLDARQRLERKKEEDGFELRQRQKEQEYQEEKRQATEMFKLQIRQLGDALADQIDEINRREQERYREAAARRDEDFDRAEADWRRRKDQEEANLGRSITRWARYWDNVAQQAKVGSEQIENILRDFLGPGGEVDKIIASFNERAKLRMQIEADVRRAGGISTPSGVSRTPATYDPKSFIWSWLHEHQYGGSGIASQPTLIPAGVHGPERYSVQPMSSIGGTLNVQWQGGAIPIQGEGNLQGIDLSAIGDAVATGLVSSLGNALTRGGL